MLPFNVWAQSLWETLYMVILSTAISYLIGLPLGLTLVVTDKNGIRPMPVLNTVLGIVTNILRSIPFLILAVMITPVTRAIVGKAIGTTAMVVPLTFAAAPYVARMVESSIKEVPFGVIEAAQSMGASPWQIVWKVLVPEAKPSLMVGGAISIVTILGYSAMAGFIGGSRQLRLQPLQLPHHAHRRHHHRRRRADLPGGRHASCAPSGQAQSLILLS